MVRFSCFHTHIYNHKSKKEVHQTAESMKKAYQVFSENQALKFPCISSDLNLLVLKTSFDNPSNSSGEQVMNSSSPEHCRKSEETHACFSPEADFEVHRGTYLKKSQSLASGLDRRREVSSDDEAEDELDHGFSCEESHVKNSAKTFYSQNGVELFQSNNQGKFEGNGDMVHGESIFSIGDEKHVEEEKHEDFSPQLSDEHASDFRQITPATTTHIIEKSSSLPNVRILLHASEEGSQDSPSQVYIRCHSRSFEDLDALNAKRKEVLNEVGFPKDDEERENNLQERGKIKCDKDLGGRYDSNNFSSLERDGTLSRRSDPNRDVMNQHERESLDESCKKLPSMDFKIKRIAEWVSQIDLGESSPLPDTSEPFESNAKAKRVPSVSVATVSTGKLDLKANHGMEAAKNYISSLTATSTTAQLANFGLVAIPFLSAFVSLKVLNLSGNGIVRITAGALPRGLHVLNLAKNNISTIEGLRELVRLRVLDLSYNRVLRVGHGLASCSSLKELYLAGNKISEVEGLHRLLKLNILDLRFNKISTAKCLGQLAANYVSLQSLNLEGNPAQRNVGDEHLKKYLHGLLPHLVYYNKQQIKVSSLKEVAERPGRSALTAHSSDRSLRSEHKLVRKGIHNAAISKGLPSSSSHGVRGHSVRSPKRSKDHHHGRLPPAGTKGAHHNRHHFLDIGSKWLNLRPGAASIRRSRSEGNLEFA